MHAYILKGRLAMYFQRVLFEWKIETHFDGLQIKKIIMITIYAHGRHNDVTQ